MMQFLLKFTERRGIFLKNKNVYARIILFAINGALVVSAAL